jgi:sodium/potassium/calcium exchanger 6
MDGKKYILYFNQLTIPISFFIIFLIFRFISSVVEEFLAPAITYISEWLKLPEALAAVTLLALANGAGDVITALVASGSPGGLSYNIGSIYGAGFFVCSIVVAMTIFSSPNDIQLEANSIWRDVGFYILSTLVIIVFGVIGELTTMSAITMLACYCLLVVIVYIQEKNKPEEKEEEKEE